MAMLGRAKGSTDVLRLAGMGMPALAHMAAAFALAISNNCSLSEKIHCNKLMFCFHIWNKQKLFWFLSYYMIWCLKKKKNVHFETLITQLNALWPFFQAIERNFKEHIFWYCVNLKNRVTTIMIDNSTIQWIIQMNLILSDLVHWCVEGSCSRLSVSGLEIYFCGGWVQGSDSALVSSGLSGCMLPSSDSAMLIESVSATSVISVLLILNITRQPTVMQKS